ncbi:Cna B-type domain-containing protein [Proteiniclasticum sp. BAD-10]|uniref:Cna B-type domain-containing protein n=1 Tax=Proteiniclasticum sediminis TaxID=2804028 RepID=A0A941HPS9_9CLOT|nr:FctA domain-containing protein [Proteiniclasticum sediminis]MBR0575669.1 Cna B-type domain-containing protein [Proteiniclasticum sediminis]
MTKNRLRRTFVAVLLLLSFVLPNFQFSTRVSGAEGPTTFTSDPGYQVVDIFYGDSTNSHTSVDGLVWVSGDYLYAVISSTHTVKAMTMQVNTAGGMVSVPSVSRWEYLAGTRISIDGTFYSPDLLNGNTKDSHFTIFTFPRAQLQGTLSIFVEGQGGGHNLGGDIIFDLVTNPVTIGKIWTGGSIASGKTASFAIFGVAPSGVYRLDAYDVNDQVITPLTLTSNVSGARVSRTFQVPITTKFGERFTSYYVRELENGQVLSDGARTSDGYVVTYPGSALEAVNTYVPQPISVTFSGTKSLSGRPLKAGEFQFALYALGSATPLAVTTNSDLGAFTFASQTYTAAGTYRYIVKETAGTLGGVTYDVREYPVTVTVTDNLKGVLSTSVSAPVGSFTFQNRYEALPASLTLSGTKTLTGRPLLADEFIYELYNAAGDILLDSASNTSGGTFQFDALTFQVPGTYTYVVRERKGTLPGITYDAKEYTITVNVTDNLQGNLVATPVIPEGGIHFVNRYLPQNAQVSVTGLKVLTGRPLKAGEFQFVLKDAQGYPVGNPVTHDAQGLFRFPELSLDKAGVYTYFVSEVPGALGGITYDPVSYPVTITVTDDLQGKLHGVVLSPPVIIRNTYQPSAVTAVIRGQKVLEGRALQAGEFQFVLEDLSGNPLGQAVANLADGSFQFPGIQFGQPGEYTFRVREVAGTLGGVTYDPSVKTVKVTVTQNSEGELVAVVNPLALTFTNTYEAKPVGVTLQGEKRLTGRPLKSGEFSFLLKDKDGAAVGTSVTHNALGEFSFPQILFTKTGVYTYTIEEIPGTVPGITYDLTKKTVTITVTDDGKGQLKATVETLPVVITNTYTPAPVEVSLEAEKVLQGRSLTAGEFSFMLKGPQGETLGVYTHDATGKILLPKVTLDAAGVYPYTLQENPGTLGGVTYDLTPKTLTVTVTDDGNGKLQSTVNPTLTQITNTYTAKAVSVELKAEKHLTGRLLKAGEFSFILRNAAGAQLGLSVTNGADGMITFPAWSFDAPGTYKLYLEEVQGTLGGVTYDAVIHEVTVTVTDDGKGQLKAAVSPELPKFTNAYQAKSVDVTLKGEKILTGRPLLAEEFSFILKDEAGDVVGSPVKNQADGSFSFPAQTFTQAGVYHYTISEVAGSLSGVNYDLEEKAVTVTVTDDGNGQLQAEVTPDQVTVENTYGPTPATLILEGEKTLSGRPLKAGEFTFELWEKNGMAALQSTVNEADGSFAFEALKFTQAGTYTYTVKETKGALGGITYDEMTYDITITVTDNLKGALVASAVYPEGGLEFVNSYKAASTTTVLEGQKILEGRPLLAEEFSFELWAGDELLHTVKNAADGSFSFPALTYTAVGTYTYTMKEVLGTLGGVTYDDAEFTITVTVKDNLDGTLTATPVYPEGGVEFVNTYKAASTTTVLEGEKTLEGRSLLANEFSFELWADDELLHTVQNAADGSFSFPALTYTKIGTYTYTVKEVEGTLGGVTYDDAEFTITVTVKDNLDGTLTATPVYPEGGVEFVNTYKAASTTAVLEGEKTLEGRPLLAEEFSFELWADDELLHTVKNEADGSFSFPALTYTEVGTYTYTVKEVLGTLGGVTYDDTEYTITVTVKDNLDGTLTATLVYPEGGVEFVNIYKAASTTTVLEGLKTLEGRPLLAEEFSFELWSGDELLHTVKNDADGKIEFPALTYTEAGTYTYTVKEVLGELGGITYDDAEYRVTVTVKDNLDGTLTTTAEYPENGLEFVNTYMAAKTTYILSGLKTLLGRELLAGEFIFELWAKDGEEPLETVKNAADGTYGFTALEFTEAGVYGYEIRERKENAYGVLYDETVYPLVISVKDNLDGTLTATADKNPEDLLFENRYAVITIKGEKTWDDLGLRPESITVQLLRNGVLYDDVVVKADENGKWTYEFPELAEFDEMGEAYRYTVKEVPVPGFESTVDGYNLLNRLLRGTLKIEKVDDADRPLAGVDFVIRDAEERVVFTGTTDETGILRVILPLGSYTVMETKAPENYIMDAEAKTVRLTTDKEEVTLRVVNVLEIEDVENKPLPSTGSAGGALYLLLGLTLLGAGLLLLKKQKTV